MARLVRHFATRASLPDTSFKIHSIPAPKEALHGGSDGQIGALFSVCLMRVTAIWLSCYLPSSLSSKKMVVGKKIRMSVKAFLEGWFVFIQERLVYSL